MEPTQEKTQDPPKQAKKNRLANEKSPYLLQHADNPVDWYPWGEEAFQKAKAENKPVFLSIGYSTCHWCHVMEHESFENGTIAAYLNENFVSIKVDREERPDIDEIYMTALTQAMGHPSGGWPLTMFLTGTAGRSSAARTSRPRNATACPASSTSCGGSGASGTRRTERSSRTPTRSSRRCPG